jgi:putative ABC transport system substrate-binding protein
MQRIGVVVGPAQTREDAARIAAFEHGLQALGWTKDRDLRIEYRWSDGNRDRIATNAREIVAMGPDVIVAQSTPVVEALLRLTRSVPIVFVHVSDPVGSGFVASFARPGGNVTGFTDIEPSLASKWLELLKEIKPGLSHAAMLFNPDTAPVRGSVFFDPFEAAARAVGVTPVRGAVHAANEIEAALIDLRSKPQGGLIVMPESFVSSHRAEIIALAARWRLPAVYPYRFYVEQGGMMSYGILSADLYRRSAAYVDRLLRGARAQELPVQAPDTFELVINLKAAAALGAAMPPALLARADEVIE